MFKLGDYIIFKNDYGNDIHAKIYHIEKVGNDFIYHCQDNHNNAFKVKRSMILLEASKELQEIKKPTVPTSAKEVKDEVKVKKKGRPKKVKEDVVTIETDAKEKE